MDKALLPVFVWKPCPVMLQGCAALASVSEKFTSGIIWLSSNSYIIYGWTKMGPSSYSSPIQGSDAVYHEVWPSKYYVVHDVTSRNCTCTDILLI
jgi:hypothetical protein